MKIKRNKSRNVLAENMVNSWVVRKKNRSPFSSLLLKDPIESKLQVGNDLKERKKKKCRGILLLPNNNGKLTNTCLLL